MKRKLFSMLFVLVMVITMIPFRVFAENTGADSSQSESFGEFISGEQVIRDMIEKRHECASANHHDGREICKVENTYRG